MHQKGTKHESRVEQSGFSLIIAILSIAIVLAIGFAVWYIWRSNQGEGEQSSNNSDQTSQRDQNGHTQEVPEPAEEIKYFVIEEWGVKFPLGKLASDYKISYAYSTDDNNVNNSTISSVSFTVPDGSRLQYCINIHIDRERQDFREVSSLSSFPIIANYDSYIYYERRSQSYCAEENSETEKAAEALMNDIADGIRSLQKVNH